MGEVVSYASTSFLMSGGSVLGDVNPRGAYVEISGGIVRGEIGVEGGGQVVMSAGSINGRLLSVGSSVVTMSGGSVVDYFDARGSSAVEMRGGSVGSGVQARDSSTVTITGGLVSGDLEAYGSANIILRGEDFEVDGVPVPLGPLEATFGTLTGNLRYGGTLYGNFFRQGAPSGLYTGTITLIPEPGTGLLVMTGMLGLATWRRLGS